MTDNAELTQAGRATVTVIPVEDGVQQYCRCGAELGKLVERDGKTVLKVGNLRIEVMRNAACDVCGKPYPFMASDKTLAQMIERKHKEE